MTVEFGIFDHLDRGGRPLDRLYEERLQLVEAYDRLGYHAFFSAEHHATPLGVAPSDRKSTRLNSSHIQKSRMPSSA